MRSLHEPARVHLAPPGCQDVAVVYTETQPTLAALRKAAALADGLHVRMRLLVPQVVPYPLPLDQPPVPEPFPARKLHTLLPDASVETRIDILLCRDRIEGLLPALAADSIVVMGVPKRFWPGWERRLARRLQKRGHEVLLLPC
jgi:hypothetical protein